MPRGISSWGASTKGTQYHFALSFFCPNSLLIRDPDIRGAGEMGPWPLAAHGEGTVASTKPSRDGRIRRRAEVRHLRVKVTRLAQKLGQLEAVNRDLQSKSWANLQLLGQPCNFRALRARRKLLSPGQDPGAPHRKPIV